jgi:hypothetical protein
MKIIALGDTHGRTYWKQIVSNTEFDKVVFIGDYFDTHEDIPYEQQKSNFEDIVAFKKENRNKVVLLFGNHDYHYLKTVNETYGGFQEKYKTAIQEMLHSALESDLMQMCFVDNNYIFTHAGVTQTWLDNTGYSGEVPIELFINDLFKYQPLAFKFTCGEEKCTYGDEVCQTPIWVRPQSLYQDGILPYIHIVGHTTQQELKITDDEIILIDTLGTSGQFLCITDGKMSVLELSKDK